MAATAAEGGMGAIAEIAAKRVFHTVYLGKYPEAVEERRAVLLEIDPIGFRAACMALIDADLVADLPRLAVPTLVICGELDQATPPELNRLIAAKVAGARYTELPRCGHCPRSSTRRPSWRRCASSCRVWTLSAFRSGA